MDSRGGNYAEGEEDSHATESGRVLGMDLAMIRPVVPVETMRDDQDEGSDQRVGEEGYQGDSCNAAGNLDPPLVDSWQKKSDIEYTTGSYQ